MHLFRNILLLTGNDIRSGVLEQIIATADKRGAKLKLIKVNNPHFEQGTHAISVYNPLYVESLLHPLKYQDAEIMRRIKQSKLRVQAKAIKGDPHRVVLSEIERDQHDLVVVEFGHKNVLLSTMFISTTMQLLRNCPIPVLVSRPSHNIAFKQILAAVDPLDSSGAFEASANALNDKIMALTNAIALNMNQQVHILNCWRHPMKERMQANSRLSKEKVHKILLEAREQQKARLANFLKINMSNKIRYRLHLRQGKPERFIPSVAKDYQINMVIIGSVGRSGLDGLMVGNTAERILCHSDLSLLVVKPHGYRPVAINDITPAEAACEL